MESIKNRDYVDKENVIELTDMNAKIYFLKSSKSNALNIAENLLLDAYENLLLDAYENRMCKA